MLTDEERRLAAEAPDIMGMSALAYFLERNRNELQCTIDSITDALDDGQLYPAKEERLRRLSCAARLAMQIKEQDRAEHRRRGLERRRQKAIERAQAFLAVE